MISVTIPVVVSIATIPSRIAYIKPTLDSLLSGNLPPDLILVNAPEFCKLENSAYVIPDFLADYSVFGGRVQFVRSAVDWGPGTKILGPLPHLTEESILVIADDDIVYHPEFLHRLVTAQRTQPNHAYSFYVYRSSGLSIGQGCDGLSIWSPHLDGIEMFAKRFVANTTLIYHDDIWIAFFLATKKVKICGLPVPTSTELVYNQVLPNNVLSNQIGQLKRETILAIHLPRLLRDVDVSSAFRIKLLALNRYDFARNIIRRARHKVSMLFAGICQNGKG